MVITICGSMSFASEMLEIKHDLEKNSHVVFTPSGLEEYLERSSLKDSLEVSTLESAKRKIDNDFVRKHLKKIKKADCILVINKDKKGIKNYIGANSFLEMGYAYSLNKPICLYQDLPDDQEYIIQEVLAMQPIVLNGDIRKIII